MDSMLLCPPNTMSAEVVKRNRRLPHGSFDTERFRVNVFEIGTSNNIGQAMSYAIYAEPRPSTDRDELCQGLAYMYL